MKHAEHFKLAQILTLKILHVYWFHHFLKIQEDRLWEMSHH